MPDDIRSPHDEDIRSPHDEEEFEDAEESPERGVGDELDEADEDLDEEDEDLDTPGGSGHSRS